MNISLHPTNLSNWQENKLEYKRYDYPLCPSDTVLDLGSYQGEFARKINDMYGCHVVCVEPTDAITGLQRNGAFTIINKAVSTYTGRMRFGGLFYYTSAYQDGYSWRDFDCIDVNDVFDREYALVKINIEGSEYEVLRHLLDNDKLKLAKNLQIQFHFIEGRDCCKEYREIAERLCDTHRLQWHSGFVWESWERRESV